jgi:hypothetical protein
MKIGCEVDSVQFKPISSSRNSNQFEAVAGQFVERFRCGWNVIKSSELTSNVRLYLILQFVLTPHEIE